MERCVGIEKFSLGDVRFAVSARSRLRGLLRARPSDPGLVLVPCRDVHTFGMHAPIDIAFIGSNGRVLDAYRSIGSGKRIRSPGASFVVERFSKPNEPWFQPGDEVTLAVR